MYIYESHSGGLYTSDELIDSDCLYCEQCGDSDWLLGEVNTKEEARRLLKSHDFYTGYIKEFLKEYFPD